MHFFPPSGLALIAAAMAAATATAGCGPGRADTRLGGTSGRLQPSRPGASTLADDSCTESKDTKNTAAPASERAVDRRAAPIAERIYQEMESGGYPAALRDIGEFESIYAGEGRLRFGPSMWFDDELECNFQLGAYDRVLSMWRQNPHCSWSSRAAVGLILIKEGRLQEGASMASDDEILRWHASPLASARAEIRTYLPHWSTPEESEARLRLLRGDEFLNGRPSQALRELERAHSTAPDQPLVQASLADAYLQNRMDSKAVPLARQLVARGGIFAQQWRHVLPPGQLLPNSYRMEKQPNGQFHGVKIN